MSGIEELEQAVYDKSSTGELRQGEILAGLVQVRQTVATLGLSAIKVDQVVHSLAIVLSQDCDLEQDFKNRPTGDAMKQLPSVLLCQVVPATTFKGSVDKRIWDRILINKDERYQFLQNVRRDEDAAGEGISSLGIDFKRYFSIATDELYRRIEIGECQRRTRLRSPYAEHLSARFYYYQSRIALPRDHDKTQLS